MLLQESLDYTVQLPEFEGPLDLLLRLIEREELDITTIALAQVADTYLAQVRALDVPDPAALSAFLVIAAKLLLIKSRALLPRPAAAKGADESIDEGVELARQLREYQRFKQAAALLRSWEEQGHHSYARAVAPPAPLLPQQPRAARCDAGRDDRGGAAPHAAAAAARYAHNAAAIAQDRHVARDGRADRGSAAAAEPGLASRICSRWWFSGSRSSWRSGPCSSC